MQHVSENWKGVQRQQLVNETYVEISFDVADPDAVADATSEDNGAIYIADTAQIVSEVDKNIVPYATLEENLWLLDGSRRFIPGDNYGDNGFIGNTLSKGDGGFDKNPVINIKFTTTHKPIIPGITITWGIAYDEYAEVFKVTAYNGDTVVAEKRIDDNTSVKSVVELDIENYSLIRVEVIKWCLPYHRPRVAEIFVGVNKVFDKSNITGYEHEQEISPIGATTPINKVGFSVDNSDNIFDPNNITGVSKYLMERQEMRVRYGMKLNDGTIEYIPAGVFYLSQWDAPQNGIEASFTARDLLEFLRKNYAKGEYKPEGISLYDLAIDVLNTANLPLNDDGSVKWVVDDSLRDIRTVAPLPVKPLSECLQYIAQAASCVLYCDRDGILHIEPISTAPTDYALTTFNMFSRPEVSLLKPLKEVSVKVYDYSVGENTDVTLKDDGELTITVGGEQLESKYTEHVIEVGRDGETQVVDNPLITSTAIAERVGGWVRDWLSYRKLITMGDWRADPRLDATDIITSENKYSTDTVRMTSVKYTYAGAFKATGEGVIV